MGDVLITGSTGFVGLAVVRALISEGLDGRELRCLVRDRSRAEALGLPSSSIRVGALGDPDALLRASEGVAATIHLAGATRALSRRAFLRVNADGTHRLCAALATAAPGSRLVHVSSLAAAGPSVDGTGTAAPPESCHPRSHYGESKRRGELQVQQSGLPWVILRPPIVYGPGDAATRLLFRQALAPLVVVPWRRRPLSLVHVDDVVRAICSALDSPLTRRILPIDGPVRLDTDRLLQAAAQACDVRARLFRVPMLVARGVAAVADLWATIVRKPSFFSLDKLRDVAAAGWVADGEAIREHLDFRPAIDPSVGLAQTAEAEGLR